jgi:hypothetical protein
MLMLQSETSLLLSGALSVAVFVVLLGAVAVRGVPELVRLRAARITPVQVSACCAGGLQVF